ncbi:ATP-binding protein [Streptomyces sp. NPDC002671]
MNDMNGEADRVRLLPWTGAHGQPSLLLTDGDGTASKLADRIENVQLGLADRLLGRTRQALSECSPDAGDIAGLAAQLVDALADTLLIAKSRGARLGGTGRTLAGDVPAVPLPVEVVNGVVADGLAAPRAYGVHSFPGDDLASAPAARRHVRDTARSWGLPPGVTDDLETIAGELVANALEHSDSLTITVTCALTARSVTISVTDEGNGSAPVPHVMPARLSGPDQEEGRGLLIAEALATRWGTRWTGDSLTVWVEVLIDDGAQKDKGLAPEP